MRDLRERLDTATQSLSEREGRLRESEERGRERGEEAVRLGREMKEAATEIEQLKVWPYYIYCTHKLLRLLCVIRGIAAP